MSLDERAPPASTCSPTSPDSMELRTCRPPPIAKTSSRPSVGVTWLGDYGHSSESPLLCVSAFRSVAALALRSWKHPLRCIVFRRDRPFLLHNESCRPERGTAKSEMLCVPSRTCSSESLSAQQREFLRDLLGTTSAPVIVIQLEFYTMGREPASPSMSSCTRSGCLATVYCQQSAQTPNADDITLVPLMSRVNDLINAITLQDHLESVSGQWISVMD